MSKIIKPQPFIKWVGGKRKIANKLIEHIPDGLNNYYEPFLGGGALFFNIKHKFNKCLLSDINSDLITTYNMVKEQPDELCKQIDVHEQNHSKEYYLKVRDTNNNGDSHLITAAKFMYLNKYSFRGVYRINNKGKQTCSFSSKWYKTSKKEDTIKSASMFLKDVKIYTGDFSSIEATTGDFVYLDPPYHKSGERYYTQLPFDEVEQVRLRDFVNKLGFNGVKIMLSNSNTDFIRGLYKDYNIKTIEVKYALDLDRPIREEVLITNY